MMRPRLAPRVPSRRSRAARRCHASPSSPNRARRYPSRMRLSHLFFTTLRDDPSDAEMPSHRLLVRAGYVRQLGAGIYSLLPLGFRVAKRVEQVIREEMDRIGCQEMEMPVVHPADLWKETGRWYQIGPEMARFKDRGGRDMVLAMTHEEVVADLLARPREELPPAPDDGLPLPDEVARRAALPGRADPRPRVRHEGLVHLRPRRGRPRRRLREALRGLHPDLRAPGPAGDRGRLGRGDDGRLRRPRVHGPQRVRRGRPGPVRDVRLLGQPPGRARSRVSEPPAERAPPARGGRDARDGDDRRPRGVPRDQRRGDRQGDLLRGRRRAAHHRHRPRRHGGQRDEARQRDGRPGAPAGPGRGDQGRRAWSPATARRSARAAPSSSWTSWWRARPTSSPARTARGSTTATSTSGATTRPTWSRTSRTPARATAAPPAARP